MLIALDGIDGSGKDTQRDLLAAWLLKHKNQQSICLNEPDEQNPIGQLIRKLLKSGELPDSHAPLFVADRIALQMTQIIPALNDGWCVLCARSFLSTLVYQQENWPLDWLFDLHRELPVKPDLVIILDLDAKEGLERAQKRPGHMEYYEKIEVQERNRERYKALLNDPRLQRMLADHGMALIIDASGTPDEVHGRILEALDWGNEDARI